MKHLKFYKIVIISLIITLIFSNIDFLNGKKKKKTIEDYRIINKPDKIDNDLYCISCMIPLVTIIDRSKDSFEELEIEHTVTESCEHSQSFYESFEENKEENPDPEIKNACGKFILNWEDHLFKYVKKYKKDGGKFNKDSKKDFVADFCVDKTRACENVEKLFFYNFVEKLQKDGL